MRERQNAKSLGAVHTHTHTHTHTQILIQWKNLAIQRCYVNKADLLDSLEREQCLAKTGRVFCAQKIEKKGKRFNITQNSLHIYFTWQSKLPCAIKLGYKEMAEAF